MVKKENAILFFIVLLILSIFSGAITYRIVVNKGSKRPVLQSDGETENKESINESNIKDIEEHQESDISINSFFDEIENINIKNEAYSLETVNIGGKEKAIVVANFKALQKIRATEKEFRSQVFDSNSYSYIIELSNENINFKFYEDSQYMMAQKVGDLEDEIYIYKLNKKEIENFIKVLENAYLNGLANKILHPLPDKIYINANDENALYVVKNREIEKLISKFKILSIEEIEENIGIPTMYPSYDITIERDYEYKLFLKNDELMVIDTPILYLYCRYDKELWDYVVDKLPQENNSKENELKFLLNADKVFVKDLEGTYDFENSTYYNIELPRQILRSELERLDDQNNIIINEDLRFVLKFYIEEKIKQVWIYDNYILYEDRLYYSKDIKGIIRSVLMIP
ncbi:hypothetical protein [Maledivibacter halophilus]|uniref:DUF4340 domain-containing protein n=1 Tax=Maledivibacter halophilus TaxID=36842 RepID=A0A1T5MSR5_9FIRM|nr:hypothetical protein [Maledivibacter halophilus]SKC91222.1 hypothetical protein SAMN02194393_05288 [Maledivibacter halophilus]